jgi:uncharacterized protein YjiS (DUF1127 family)
MADECFVQRRFQPKFLEGPQHTDVQEAFMTQFHKAAAAGKTFGQPSMISGLFDGMKLAMRRFDARQRLLSLDDRLLRDIGVNRGDIAAGEF